MGREKTQSSNKQERGRNPPYKQDHVFLFTVNKDNWPIRREDLSNVTIIMEIVFTSQDHYNFAYPSSLVLIFSKFLYI